MQYSGNFLEKTSARILAIALGIILLFLIFLFAFIFPVVQDALFDSRKMASKNLVDSVCSMLEDYRLRVEKNEITEQNARRQALERIRYMRFENNGYIWINDTSEPYPRMILHPARPALEGRSMDDDFYRTASSMQLGTDGAEKRFGSEKRHFFKVFLEVAQKSGSGFVEYKWRRPTSEGVTEELYPKKSYVKLFEPWGWIIGTGVYIDDVYAQMNSLKWTIISMAAAILVLALAGTFLIMRTITGPINQLAGFATNVAGGDMNAQIQGRFTGEMRQLKDAISKMVAELRTRMQEAEARAKEAESAREALKRSEERFELAVRGTNDGIWDWHLETGDVFFSRRWKEIIGYEDHELENRIEQWKNRIHPDDYDSVMAAHQMFYESSAEQFAIEYRLQHRDGSYRWILGRSACIRDRHGKPVRLAGAHTDITEKKEAEKTLMQSEEKYRLLFENAPLGLLHFDQKGVITACNDRFVELIGSSRQDLAGMNIFNLPDGDAVAAVKAALNGRQGVYKGVYRSVTGGKATPARALIEPFRDSTGNVVGGVGMVEDISERKKAEDALRESEEKYRILVENAKEAIFVVQDGLIRFANQATCELTGYSLEELTSRKFTDFMYPEDSEFFQGELFQPYSGVDHEAECCFRILGSPENVRWGALKSVEIEWEGRPATLNFLSDITEQKKARQEREKLEMRLRQAQKIEALGTLTGGVAHDFNNILSIIMGYTELLQAELPEDHEAQKGLREISSAGRRARDVVRQLLTFSRRGEEEKSPQNISFVIKEGIRMIRSTTPSFIDIREDISTDLPLVMANPTKIHQLIINLCKNASDAMDEKGGVLTVRFEQETLEEKTTAFGSDLHKGDYVKLTVEDTGNGIAAESLERIFDPYYTTKEVDKGTGLGLSVVLGIVQDLGGGILVDSEKGRGSRFEVFFPALQKYGEAQLPPDSENLARGTETILFVDDEARVTELAELRLKSLGYKPVCETDPEKALQRFYEDPQGFDLVITDMTMPKMTGDVLSMEILNIRPGMKIILCTGYSERISEDTAIRAGIARYVEKPLEFADLAREVRSVLDE
ncbi:MAG: PAS domain S-box protein [Desulfobacterales bacterium]